MVRANRWKLEEAVADSARMFEAAKAQSPQLVMSDEGVYTVSYQSTPEKTDAALFLAAGGPEKRES